MEGSGVLCGRTRTSLLSRDASCGQGFICVQEKNRIRCASNSASWDHHVRRRLIIEPIIARFACHLTHPASRPPALPLDGCLDGAANKYTITPQSVTSFSRISKFHEPRSSRHQRSTITQMVYWPHRGVSGPLRILRELGGLTWLGSGQR